MGIRSYPVYLHMWSLMDMCVYHQYIHQYPGNMWHQSNRKHIDIQLRDHTA